MNDITDSTPNQVTVTVAKDGQGNVVITCTPDPVQVNAFNTLISFNLATAGYHFLASNTIVLDSPQPDFPYPAHTVNATLATLLDLCTTSNSFKYTVYVVDTATGTQYSLDPVIKNGAATCQP